MTKQEVHLNTQETTALILMLDRQMREIARSLEFLPEEDLNGFLDLISMLRTIKNKVKVAATR